jgi:3-oxoacyl-[acyl-carrier protein] reductase
MTAALFLPTALAEEVALVTGASRGIGAAILDALARAGATVIGTATTEAGAQAISARIADLGARGRGEMLDVRDGARCEALVDRIGGDFGKLSVLVNNAGITRDALALRLKDDDWSAVIDTNLAAAFRLIRSALRGMMKARHGRIINISSVVAASGNAGQTSYAAAKAGLEGMSRALAREVGSRGICVNCVAPGFFDTDMTRKLGDTQAQALLAQIPVGRLGQPEEVAAAVVFLASTAGAYITGSTLHVNGGMHMG